MKKLLILFLALILSGCLKHKSEVGVVSSSPLAPNTSNPIVDTNIPSNDIPIHYLHDDKKEYPYQIISRTSTDEGTNDLYLFVYFLPGNKTYNDIFEKTSYERDYTGNLIFYNEINTDQDVFYNYDNYYIYINEPSFRIDKDEYKELVKTSFPESEQAWDDFYTVYDQYDHYPGSATVTVSRDNDYQIITFYHLNDSKSGCDLVLDEGFTYKERFIDESGEAYEYYWNSGSWSPEKGCTTDYKYDTYGQYIYE